MPKYIFII